MFSRSILTTSAVTVCCAISFAVLAQNVQTTPQTSSAASKPQHTKAKRDPSPARDATGDAASPPSTAIAFRTRHATFVPASFSDLPGWSEDRLDEAW